MSGKGGGGVRFAPSPTGRFHVGNFRTACVSHAWARELGEPWVVRFEDIDGPRVVEGAQKRQLAELRELGFEPDKVLIQSKARARHWQLFRRAVEARQIYPCACSRKDVMERLATAPHEAGALYTGRCRAASLKPGPAHGQVGWRFRAADPTGRQDFLIARTDRPGADGMPPADSFTPAYPWACAIDDFDGEHALLVRAWDLAHALESQRSIQAWLARLAGREFRPPAVFHAALVTAANGARLEKRTPGVTLDEFVAMGVSPTELARKLGASIPPGVVAAGEFASGRVWGEANRELRLRDVLIR